MTNLIKLKLLMGLMLVMCIALTATTLHAADDGDLKLGEEMPEYTKGIDWLKKLEDTSPEIGSRPLVIEFWATWCGPCKAAIPHLTKLQNRYGAEQLSVIGLTVPDDRQSGADIKRFVQRQGSRMDYWVGTFGDKDTSEAMKAAGKAGFLPLVLIIGLEGRIQYIGHPMDPNFDRILDLVVKGRYDYKSAKKAKKHLDEIKRARRLKNWGQYYKLSQEVLEINPKTFYEIYLDHFDVELLERNNPEKAYAEAQKLVIERSDDPHMLAWLSEHIATNPDIPDDKRDLDVALEIVVAARQSGGESDPVLMAMEAKIRMTRGELEDAIRLQRRAYMAAPTGSKPNYKRDLQDYKSQFKRLQETE
ncbi:MAG: TlpA disulfide reductase family protein [Planctomycetota bacterium]|nr:TlpA disulfide reductase family protein [Planctomycetota bacterium]